MLPKVVAGVVAISKYAHAACRDDKQWSVCIDAYRNGECHAFEGCQRTCGKCYEETDCFDLIPDNHSFLFAQGFAAKSMWPNYQNNGENSFPTAVYDVDDHFPFDRSSVSQFCQDIFDHGLCETEKNLELTYEDITIPLSGVAKEYCAFSCGNCKAQGEMGDCWRTHNNNMQYLSDLNAPTDHGTDMGNINWEDMWGGSDWGTGEDTEAEAEDTEEETDDWGSLSDWGSDSWWRKRRSASGFPSMDKSDILAEAIESLIFPAIKDILPLNSRNRRMAWGMDGMIGQQAGDHEETERIKAAMGNLQCFKSMMSHDTQEDGEGEEEEEEEAGEEEFEDPVIRVRQQRKATDHKGIRQWVSNIAPEGTTIDGDCDDFIVPVEEAYSEMELGYTCQISCAVGTPFVDQAGELVSIADGLQMECRKPNYRRFQEAATCGASLYCVGTACQPIVCIEEQEEQIYADYEEEEVLSEFTATSWDDSDFLMDGEWGK